MIDKSQDTYFLEIPSFNLCGYDYDGSIFNYALRITKIQTGNLKSKNIVLSLENTST